MTDDAETTRTPFSPGEPEAAHERARAHLAKALARPEVQEAFRTYRDKVEKGQRERDLKRASA